MRYLSLPVHLLKFWYLESLIVFLRVWKNTLLYLEEDLAVELMWKLLFVPLFHDSTIIGRALSFGFRSFRILLGLGAFFLATVILASLALSFYLLPLLVFTLTGTAKLVSLGVIFSGIVFFLNHLLANPEKKLWQIKKLEDLWQASVVKRGNLQFTQLLRTDEVGSLLLYLEQDRENFARLSSNFEEREVLQKAWDLGKKLDVVYLDARLFFVAFLSLVPGIDKELLKYELRLEDFVEVLDFFQKRRKWWRIVWPWDEDFHVFHLRGVNRGWIGVPTPNLDLVSEDLTKKASKERIVDFLDRTQVVASVISVLSLEKSRNVVVVGEPGSGRSTLVSYLAKRIVLGDAPESLAMKRLVKLELTKLLGGITSQGELAERVKDVFAEVEDSGNLILFIDEIHNLGVGEVGGEFNLYSLLLPYLESDKTQFIATTEIENYTRILERNSSFAHLFTKIELPPADVLETVNILKIWAIEHERKRRVCTSLPALRKMAELAERFLHERVLPDAALGVFLQTLDQAENGWIRKKLVEKVVGEIASVPVGEVEGLVKTELLDLERVIHQKLIDQEEAVAVVGNTLRRAAVELRDQDRPIGSFLFVGPTGVGKTELAKILAQEYFQGQGLPAGRQALPAGRQGTFLRLDMSEYQNSASIGRLIGEMGEEGQLTEAVRRHPYSLILLDEFEKADPKILTLFLQVLEDGRLTSGSGRTVDFTNTIIIATSNAAALTIARGLGAGQSLSSLKRVVNEELLKILGPELLNRFDEVVLFKPLSPWDLQRVVKLKLAALQRQLQKQGFLVEFTEGVMKQLVQRGYDPILGARPLRRLIQDTIEAKLSVLILQNKLPKGEKFVVEEQLLAGW